MRARGAVSRSLATSVLVGGVGATAVAGVQAAPEPVALQRRAPALSISIDTDRPLFGPAPMAPGMTTTNCVRLTYRNPGAASTLKLYAQVQDGGLGRLLTMRVDTGSGGGAGACQGFRPGRTVYTGSLHAFGNAHGDAVEGLDLGSLPGAQGSVTFRFSFSLPRSVTTQGVRATAGFFWTARGEDGQTATTGTPAVDGGGTPPPARSWLHRIVDALVATARRAFVPVARITAIGFFTAAVAALFLIVQNRIDRRDPKLADAPVRPPDDRLFLERDAVA
jgi:hypothetical protein